MRRREPPSLATWMLEHLTPGDRDEALGGDLLEEFRLGRSDDWYWWQVLSACSGAWLRSLRAHISLIAFALLWSMPAPAWTVLCDHIQDYRLFHRTWQIVQGFWILPAFAVWTSLHATFLWAGILIYIVFHARAGTALRTGKVRRAFWLAPLIFLPVIGAAFVLMNLYSFPGLVTERLAATTLGQIGDLRMPADVLRIPYFIALLYALWGVVPKAVRAATPVAAGSSPIPSQASSDGFELLSALDPFLLKRFFGFMVGAGLMNAMIGSFLLCRLPETNAPDLISILIRAAIYVAVAVLAGLAGTWLYWRNPSSPFRRGAPVPFALFALVCAAGWVWVPAMAILSEQLSAGTAIVAMIGAFVLASGLRRPPIPSSRQLSVALGPRKCRRRTLRGSAAAASGGNAWVCNRDLSLCGGSGADHAFDLHGCEFAGAECFCLRMEQDRPAQLASFGQRGRPPRRSATRSLGHSGSAGHGVDVARRRRPSRSFRARGRGGRERSLCSRKQPPKIGAANVSEWSWRLRERDPLAISGEKADCPAASRS